MGSTRLPGKPLMYIAGTTMLERIISRLSRSSKIQEICVATTDTARDDEIVSYLGPKNIPYSRGPENDIALRLLGASRKFGSEIIVRVWGDCPLIDVGVIDTMIEKCLSECAGYVTNSDPPTYPFGMNAEVYRAEVLERIVSLTEDPFYREFPFEYVKTDNGTKSLNVGYKKDASGIKLTVDYPQDVEVVTKVIEYFNSSDEKDDVDNIVKFCEKNKNIFDYTRDLPRNIEYKKDLKTRGLLR
jgi:glutamate-1-semialdehyde 2,1-aminomutase